MNPLQLNPLIEPLKYYEFARDSLRAISQIIVGQSTEYTGEFDKIGMTIDDANKSIIELESITIANIYFVFEATVKDGFNSYLRDELDIPIDNPSADTGSFEYQAIYYVRDAVYRKRFLDLLDLYKYRVQSEIVGKVKIVYKYRNWVAHGKIQDKPVDTINIDPYLAFEILTEFLKKAEIIQ